MLCCLGSLVAKWKWKAWGWCIVSHSSGEAECSAHVQETGTRERGSRDFSGAYRDLHLARGVEWTSLDIAATSSRRELRSPLRTGETNQPILSIQLNSAHSFFGRCINKRAFLNPPSPSHVLPLAILFSLTDKLSPRLSSHADRILSLIYYKISI